MRWQTFEDRLWYVSVSRPSCARRCSSRRGRIRSLGNSGSGPDCDSNSDVVASHDTFGVQDILSKIELGSLTRECSGECDRISRRREPSRPLDLISHGSESLEKVHRYNIVQGMIYASIRIRQRVHYKDQFLFTSLAGFNEHFKICFSR